MVDRRVSGYVVDHQLEGIADRLGTRHEGDAHTPYVVHDRVVWVIAVGYVFENRLRGDELDILVLSDEKVGGA